MSKRTEGVRAFVRPWRLWAIAIGMAALLGAPGAAQEKPNFKEDTIPAPAIPAGAPVGKNQRDKIEEKVAKTKAKVAEFWDDIVFEKDGKPVEYLVTFDTDEGPIEIEFYPEVAPIHVRSFLALAKAGFFDGLIFHRCLPGFVIQGGCPIGAGYGGPGYHLRSEFNTKKHGRGVLSMARAQDPDSAGSQFFICVADSPAVKNLDRQYTVFGRVTKGMENVDKIVGRPGDPQSGRPREPVTIQKATVKTKNASK